MDFLIALLLSLLPPRYRRSLEQRAGTHLVRAATATAFLEIFAVCVLYAKGFFDYIPHAVIGPAASLEFLFSWQGIVLAFFFLDGAARLLASLSGQALGVIPLYLVAWIHGRLEKRELRKHELPLVADIVVGPNESGEIRIASCRPRKNWDKWMTVMYEERLYEISNAELSSPPRPYIYHLRLKPDSKVIRGLHRYDPNEVLHLRDD